MTHPDSSVADIVIEALGELVPDTPVDPATSLSRLGLGSLALTRLWMVLRRRLGVDVPVTELVKLPDVAALIDRVADTGEPVTVEAASTPEPSVTAPGAALKLTDLQQAYQLGKSPELSSDPIGCHIYREFEVPDLDPERFAAAWRRAVAHHEALRLHIDADGTQRIRDDASTSIETHDRAACDREVADDWITAVRDRLSHRRFVPGEWPLWDVVATKLPRGDGLVQLGVDGSIIDGHGMSVLLDDLWHWYRDPDFRPSRGGLSLSDCLARLTSGDHAEADRRYWRDRLADLPSGPCVVGGAGDRGHRRVAFRSTVEAPQWARIEAAARRWSVSPTSVVLTLFSECLQRQRDREPHTLILTVSDRMRLPESADDVIGPFTSSLVSPMPPTAGLSLPEAASAVYERLLADLRHSAMSGVAALRETRNGAVDLPVVFTSLLDTGRPARPGDFADSVTRQLSQTSGIALDHQMWVADGRLHVHWDVAVERFEPGVVEETFAWFLNALHWVDETDPVRHPLNELQQAYFVPRAVGEPSAWDGCQVYLSFELSEPVDADRLQEAWRRLSAAYPLLGAIVDVDGGITVREGPPDRVDIPQIELATAEEATRYHAALRDRSAGRSFPLGRGPQWDVRTTRHPDGGTVHLTLDLTILDGRSIHLVARELMRLYRDPDAAPLPSSTPEPPPGDEERDRATEHWRARVAELPSGPVLLDHDEPAPRVRRQRRLSGWSRLTATAATHRVRPDDVLAALFAAVIARHHPEPFSLPVVRWTKASQPHRPGEYTRLSWLRWESTEGSPWRIAADISRRIAEDEAADAVNGLALMRRHVMRHRRDTDFQLPIVYTGLLELTDQPLPTGVTLGPWLTCTPDVSLDCVTVVDGDEALLCWDAIEERFPAGRLDAMFDAYAEAVADLCRSETDAPTSSVEDVPTGFLAHSAFEEQARRRPEAVAVRWRGGEVGFGELNAWSNRIAWRLRELGVTAGEPVAISVPRGPEMAAAVFGVLKAGGCYVPIDPGLPSGRAEVVMAESGASTVLVGARRVGWAPSTAPTVVDIDDCAGRDDDPNPVVGTDDPAYIIFTSGSTGEPKGVAVAHRTLGKLFDWCRRTHHFGPTDLGLCVTSLGFDLSAFDLLGLLGVGAGLYIADEEQQHDPRMLLDILVSQPVTFWNSAPTTLHQVAPFLGEAAEASGTDRLRLVYLSGDYTPLTLPDEVRAVFRNARVVSLGGATEATVWSNWFEIDTVDPNWRSIPYGLPIDHAEYHILDGHMRPCPTGVEGDLYIGGDCLAIGYHRRPELTRAAFLPDPFSPVPGARIYRTGDRAYRYPDGNICFTGRSDHQVKVRGFRVELGEIEHRLRMHPAVKDAVVTVEGDADKLLVGHLLPAGTDLPSAGRLRAFVAETLPDYMVPNRVRFHDVFPATSNGKLDRDALSSTEEPPAEAEPTAPLDDVVAEIAGIFVELLEVPEVKPDDDLWDLGATSFTMVRASAAIQQRHGRRIPVSVLLAQPTVAGIAADLAGTPGVPSAVEPDVVQPVEPSDGVDFFSATERAAFKAARHDLRAAAATEPIVELGAAPADLVERTARASRREFPRRPVELSELAALLATAAEHADSQGPLRRYPSAGDTYAVRIYLRVRSDGVTGLDGGLYYYHPVDHTLHRINGRDVIDPGLHFGYNRPLAGQAAFELYLFGRMDAIAPLYGDDAQRFLALEAGYLGQVLMQAQTDTAIGLCPIGSVNIDAIRAECGLDTGDPFLQAFVAGGIDRAVSEPPAGAVVCGMAGRFPDADTPNRLWRNLSSGVRSLRPATEGRRAQVGGDHPGGFLSDVDTFDSLLFHISPMEAARLDPQVRLLLTVVWECLEDAAHTAAELNRDGRVGVFLGTMWQDHRLVAAQSDEDPAAAPMSSTGSQAANRISHFFGFTGPSIAVDTSCASSLTALHLAVESIRDGECDAAVVAAGNLFLHPHHLRELVDSGLLAERLPEGAFDPEVVGWVPGEGVAAVLLRRYDSDIDSRVEAVIEATQVGHRGGRGRYGTPDAEQLGDGLHRLLAGAGLEPEHVDYIECAAAGSAVADAAEVEAITSVFGATPPPLGTVKPNIGHLEAAAGLAQLIKVIAQLGHRRFAPTIASTRPHPMIPGVVDRVVTESTDWADRPDGRPRRALVNAIGATGSHAHVIVREAPRSEEPTAPHSARVHVVLSAATASDLADLAGRWHRHLSTQDIPPSPADIAYTSQLGRTALEHRLAIGCRDHGELSAGLAAASRGDDDPSLHTGGHGEASGSPLVDRWLSGETVDWREAWPRPRPRRVALPTYPFTTVAHRSDPIVDTTGTPEHVDRMTRLLTGLYSEVSGVPLERLRPEVPLEHYGLTSLLISRLTARLESEIGRVSPTVFYEHPTLGRVAAALAITAETGPEPEPRREPDRVEPVAIIGVAGRYPDAEDVDQFWRNLVSGRDSVSGGPPPGRLGGTDRRMPGGYLAEVDTFDPLFFGITPHDAALMDPQERLFLETGWHALEDAGYSRHRLSSVTGNAVGVYAASMYNEYPFHGLDCGHSRQGRPPVATGSAIAGIANRVSYFLDCHGPSLTVDTMCSGSLTAIHLAVAGLRAGECSMALAGGVNLSLHPNKYIQLEQRAMLAPGGRCRAFSVDADGFVPGEGVGVVVLKPLSRALADGDRIHAVIEGSAVNHGGRTNGYSVPSPAAQAGLVAAAMNDAAVRPADIGYIEAHGTGTALGDPVEVSGLDRAFAGALPPTAVRPLGTVKSNIGHLEAAAGVAGLTKVIMQFRHETVAPSLHAENLNPAIDWGATPFRVQRAAAAWPAVPKRAGISSFGAGGSGAHLIVSAPPPVTDIGDAPSEAESEQLIILSARTASALRQQRQRLRSWLIDHPDVELSDVAYTLQVGREQLRHRLAIVVGGVAELCEVLDRSDEPWFTGVVTADDLHRVMVAPQPSADQRHLARQWIEGKRFDFTASHRPGRRRVVNLPGYPFERMRCWVDSAADESPKTEPTPEVPPLLSRRWQPIEAAWHRPPDPASVLCLVRADQRDLAQAVARELRTPTVIRVDGEPVGDYRAISGWLDLTALPGPLASDDENPGWRDRLTTLRDALATGRLTRVMQVTSGLLDAPGTRPRLAGARLAGFVKNLAAHHVDLQSTVLDLDVADHPIDRLARDVVAEWRTGHSAGEICRRGGDRFAPQLVATETPSTVVRLDPTVCHLVTGGTGRIGRLAVGHLVDRGATRVAILGRRRLPPRSEWDRADLPESQREIVSAIRGWEQLGCRVLVDTADLTDRGALSRFLERARRELGPIGGLIHCAGSRPEQDDASFPGRVETMFAGKVEGLDLLTELTADDPLRYAVLYSSVSATVPALAVGLPGYAGANSYLDHFASVRQRRGDHRFRSIAWPIWRRTAPRSTAACDRVGMGTLTDEAGLAILDSAIGGPVQNRIVWPVTADAPEWDLGVNSTPEPGPADEPVTRVVADCLGIAVDDLDPTTEFADLGVESVMMAELVRRLEIRYGRPIDPTSLLDHPTTAKLSRHLGDMPPEPSEAEPPSPPPSGRDDRVAVIGMACRFPGADDVAGFWRLVDNGDCAVTTVPPSRWDVDRWYDPTGAPGTSVSARGGFVTGIEEFDARYFNMSDEGAANTDPAVRLALENAAMCLADAGYTEESVRGGQVGVFMGARMSGYRDRIDVTAAPGLGGDQNFIAAALSHHFDLRGPNLVVDSACSSALVSVAMARRSLLSGETDLAFAGGVEVLLDERPYLSFTAAKALSPQGRCAPFDADADGFVPGEGCGVVLLKRLSDAIRDGDRIQAVIEAVAVGNDGRTMGLTTPNPKAQAAVIRRALSESGLTADQIGLIEAHGTGTMIGDPIELRALTQVFAEQTAATGYCAIGSVKSNIGHLLSAAGIAGLIKVVMSLGNGRRPATLFCERPNPRFDFASSPFFPNRTATDWEGPLRAAGVSAFGLGGTNAHLIATGPDPDWGPGRAALPPPGFTRRRFWLDRPESSSDAPQANASAVASVLDLRFVSTG